MSNLEAAPAEVACAASQHPGTSPGVEVLHPREVPLGARGPYGCNARCHNEDAR